DEAASLTREHDEKVLGTADYLAPEQATDSHVADRRSDIYALGCTLHYLLIGRAPFAKGKLTERIQAHARKPVPNIREERDDVPVPIADLYFRMMEKHPDARPQTAQEVADALGVWLKGAAGAAAAPAGPPRRGPPRRTAAPGVAPPVFRHGPGSGSSSSISLGPASPARSGILGDSGRFTPTPPPGSGRRAAGGSPPAAAEKSKPRTQRRSTGGQGDDGQNKEQKPRWRPPIQFAGLPLGFWAAVVVGIATVIYLAAQLLKSR
ncbi:MAG: hypothetical protein FJ284_05870, partial [Planctomycetes bacterium]|nr:hypothetical protein [Planctomycetota bacterium]